MTWWDNIWLSDVSMLTMLSGVHPSMRITENRYKNCAKDFKLQCWKEYFPYNKFASQSLSPHFLISTQKEGAPVYNLFFERLSSNEISVHITEDREFLNSVLFTGTDIRNNMRLLHADHIKLSQTSPTTLIILGYAAYKW